MGVLAQSNKVFASRADGGIERMRWFMWISSLFSFCTTGVFIFFKTIRHGVMIYFLSMMENCELIGKLFFTIFGECFCLTAGNDFDDKAVREENSSHHNQ
jgi:hypothetical protein